ncbi:hypothetical protein M3Y94_00859300 [Aphelenchoides besseyi]|nr:hypothetical protein M3Y94_00859300 [Aphelenchoides besseyi]KAI6226756.1 hypothetical protein M3Y95_00654500 [Aphelenchoides besseyi]
MPSIDLSDLSTTMELALTSSSTRFLDTDSSSISGSSESEASDNEDYLLDYRAVKHDEPTSSSTAILNVEDSSTMNLGAKKNGLHLKRDSTMSFDAKGRNIIIGVATLLIGFVFLMVIVICSRYPNPNHAIKSTDSSSVLFNSTY